MDSKSAVTALTALAQASRLAAFQALVELGPEGTTPSELAQRLDIPPNTLSFHLKALLQAGLVTAEHAGRHIRYRADFARIQGLIEFLTRNCCGGDMGRCAPAPVRAVARKPRAG